MKKAIITTLGVAAIACAVSPAQAESLIGVTTGNNLLRFDSASPGIGVLSPITGLGGDNLLGIDIRPATGVLYGLGSSSRIYTIDTTSGAASLVSGTPFGTLSGSSFGFDFNPVPDRIRIVSDADQNLRVNPITGGLGATDGTLAYAVGDSNFGLDPNAVGSAYANNMPGATTTTLYNIDSSLDVLVRQTPPNDGVLNTIGGLGVNTTDRVAFDISGVTGLAYASLTDASDGVSRLYMVNLATGSASLLGGFSSAEGLIGLAAPVPEPGTYMLFGMGALGLWALRNRRSK